MKKALYIMLYCALIGVLTLPGCTSPESESPVPFTKETVATSANFWWARKMVDLNGDGFKEIALSDNNAHGGWLGFYKRTSSGNWERNIISDSTRIGGTFAHGDIEAGDFDNDGDMDLLGFVNDGEWDSDTAATQIYLFKNPEWDYELIGKAPGFVKDVEVADFNNDGNLDFTVITYTQNSFQVFAQDENGWYEATRFSLLNLHEGMAVGDIDGDNFTDVAVNGYWIKSPGENLRNEWMVKSINDKWHNQGGDWSKNATKHFCRDIDEDGQAEVFITHSERRDYPVAWYDLTNVADNTWEEHVIDTIEACHTLQVFDFDNDGDYDVMAGENGNRWDDPNDPVKLYVNQGDNIFKANMITDEGIYNGLAGDIDNDADVDILRLPGHASETLEVWLNEMNQG